MGACKAKKVEETGKYRQGPVHFEMAPGKKIPRSSWLFRSQAEQFATELVYFNFKTLAIGDMLKMLQTLEKEQNTILYKSVLGKSETVSQCKCCKSII